MNKKIIIPPTIGAGGAPGLTLEILKEQQDFYNTRVKHPYLKQALDDLLPLLLPYSETNVILVTGATGVGKSTLTRNLLTTLVDDFAPLAESDTSSIPIVDVEAYHSGERTQSFKDLYTSIAEKLQEPGMSHKRQIVEENGILSSKHNTRHTTATLRRVVENGLKYRNTRVLVIDEAAHLLRFGNETAPMDTLKSLANTAGVKLVLVGSFDLLKMVTSHGQIARRTAVISFQRYQLDRAADRTAFKRSLEALLKKWPCPNVPNFLSISDQLLEVSLGCIGLLKSLLLDASAMQLRNKGEWKPEFLLKAAKSSKLHQVIRNEIETGEKLVQDALVGQSIWDANQFNTMTNLMQA